MTGASAGASAGAFLRVTEIFHSIQGESTWAGMPCTFVRLTGCPLRCVWCDTEYAFSGGERMSLDAILERVREIGTPLVEVTGGEPLVHPNALELVRRLLDGDFTVLVETSGAVGLDGLDPRAHVIMDLKCPGSGESGRNLWPNLDRLDGGDEVKFVIADRADYEWARSAIRGELAEAGSHPPPLAERVLAGRLRAILFSPVWGSMDFRELAAWILEDGLPVRYQLQIHKLVWGPSVAGV